MWIRICWIPFLLSSAFAEVSQYQAQDGQAIFEHKVRLVNVRGTIAGVRGLVELDTNDLSKTTGRIIVPVKNLKTGITLRDDHAKREDALHTAQFPNAIFELKQLTGGKLQEGQQLKTTAKGILTIKGIRKNVSIPIKALLTNGKIKINTQFKLNPHAFKVDYPGSSDRATINVKFTLNTDK